MKQTNKEIEKQSEQVDKPVKSSISMHENVSIADDCCSCAAEPYWIDAMKDIDDEPAEHEDDK